MPLEPRELPEWLQMEVDGYRRQRTLDMTIRLALGFGFLGGFAIAAIALWAI